MRRILDRGLWSASTSLDVGLRTSRRRRTLVVDSNCVGRGGLKPAVRNSTVFRLMIVNRSIDHSCTLTAVDPAMRFNRLLRRLLVAAAYVLVDANIAVAQGSWD